MVALPVGVSFSDDTSCKRITGNPCLFAQFEITPEDNISASAPDPDAPGRLVRYFHNGREVRDDELPLQRAVAENKIIPPIEFEVRLPSGRIWFTDLSGAPILDEQGRVVGGVAVAVDITDRKKAEEAVQRSELMLRAVLENMPSGLAVRDAQTGALIISNERTRQLMGDLVETPDQSLGFRCFHPDGRQYRTEEWPVVRSMKTGEVIDSEEVQVERSDGSLITLSFSSAPVRDPQGRIVAGVVVGHDIT